MSVHWINPTLQSGRRVGSPMSGISVEHLLVHRIVQQRYLMDPDEICVSEGPRTDGGDPGFFGPFGAVFASLTTLIHT
jgi:hypothetical protein